MNVSPEIFEQVVNPPRISDTALGGVIRTEPEDFEVEELPAYQPSGEGDHLFLWIEKRAKPTEVVVRSLAKALGISPNDVGTAGLKDTFAVTRQFVSVPRRAAEEAGWNWKESPQSFSGSGFEVLSVRPHENKLHTGHLNGNRFRLVIRPDAERSGGEGWTDEEIQLAQEAAQRIEETGVPNYYGEQRFGRGGSTLELGRDLLAEIRAEKEPKAGKSIPREESNPGASGGAAPRSRPRRISKSLRRLGLSALQSAVFNLCVGDRVRRGALTVVHSGDVLQVSESGGPFLVENPADEQPRVDRREVVPAGPMFGKKMKTATDTVAAWESEALARLGFVAEDFHIPGKLMLGTRRAIVIWPSLVVTGDQDGIVAEFVLPKGSYATVVLRELMGTVRSR